MSDVSQGPDWWQASDGRWYPPQSAQVASSNGGVAVTAQQAIWTPLQSAGSLVMAESSYEYAVYDGTHTYGRWPKDGQGRNHAIETFEAYGRSAAHGVAYTATGYRDPVAAGLPVDPVIKSQSYAAPLSYIGSTRRLVAWASKLSQRNPGLAVLGWTLASIAMLLAWAFITMWYIVIFGLFGVFVIPYRLIRRGQRKSTHVQKTMLATQQAMLQQHQSIVLQQAMVQRAAQQQMPVPSVAPLAAPPSSLPAPPL